MSPELYQVLGWIFFLSTLVWGVVVFLILASWLEDGRGEWKILVGAAIIEVLLTAATITLMLLSDQSVLGSLH